MKFNDNMLQRVKHAIHKHCGELRWMKRTPSLMIRLYVVFFFHHEKILKCVSWHNGKISEWSQKLLETLKNSKNIFPIYFLFDIDLIRHSKQNKFWSNFDSYIPTRIKVKSLYEIYVFHFAYLLIGVGF